MGRIPCFEPEVSMRRATGRTVVDVGDVADGLAALERGEWDETRVLLERAVADDHATAEVHDALAEARWWCGDPEGAIEARERAVTSWRADGESTRAVRAAVWIAIEYGSGIGHDPAARGWLARAATMAADTPGTAEGWVALGRAVLDVDPDVQVDAAASALDIARTEADTELEVFALARLAWAHVARGAVEQGIELFDEAMAIATAADFERLSALGDLCCQLARATEAAGEAGRFAEWLGVVQRMNRDHHYPPLVGFCATCCAELKSADGNWQDAETHLRQAIDQLHGTGHRARCGPPIAKLAELLVLQGRIEEADDLVGDDDSDTTLLARARLALANGAPATARTLAERWVRRRGDDLLAVGALSVEGEAALAAGDAAAAEAVANRIAAIAERSGNRRAAGATALLEGDIARHTGDAAAAAAAYERSLDHLAGLDGVLDVSRAHLGLAIAARDSAPEVARVEAKTALAGFDAAGASTMADSARGLLRELGDRSHVGRKGAGLLTDREVEVLRLVSRGLTNAEISERLFISVKTAGNHVSNILTKIGVRSRTEAAAFAALHPEVLAGTP